MTFDVLQFSKQKTSSTLHAVAADIMNSNNRATVNPAGRKINNYENYKGMCTKKQKTKKKKQTKDLNVDDHAQNLSAINLTEMFS